MKKIKLNFFVLILSIVTSNIYCQESGYGFKIGLSNSNIKVVNSQYTKNGKSSMSPTIGVMAYGSLSEKIGFYTELLFFNKIKTNYTDSAFNYDTKANVIVEDQFQVSTFSYYIFPVYKITNNIFLMAGPGVDMLRNKKFSDSDNSQDIHTYAMKYIIDSKTDYQFNFNIGLGFNYKLVRFDVRYNMGLTNLFDKKSAPFYPEYSNFTKATYNSIQVSLGVLIPGMEFKKINNGI